MNDKLTFQDEARSMLTIVAMGPGRVRMFGEGSKEAAIFVFALAEWQNPRNQPAGPSPMPQERPMASYGACL